MKYIENRDALALAIQKQIRKAQRWPKQHPDMWFTVYVSTLAKKPYDVWIFEACDENSYPGGDGERYVVQISLSLGRDIFRTVEGYPRDTVAQAVADNLFAEEMQKMYADGALEGYNF